MWIHFPCQAGKLWSSAQAQEAFWVCKMNYKKIRIQMFFYRNIKLYHKKRIYFIKHKVWHIKHEFKILNEITHKISCQYNMNVIPQGCENFLTWRQGEHITASSWKLRENILTASYFFVRIQFEKANTKHFPWGLLFPRSRLLFLVR